MSFKQVIDNIKLPEKCEVFYPADQQEALVKCIETYTAKWMMREIERIMEVKVSDTTIRSYTKPEARGIKYKVDAVCNLVRAINVKTAANARPE